MNQLKENIDSINVTLSKEILNEIENIHLSDPKSMCLIKLKFYFFFKIFTSSIYFLSHK